MSVRTRVAEQLGPLWQKREGAGWQRLPEALTEMATADSPRGSPRADAQLMSAPGGNSWGIAGVGGVGRERICKILKPLKGASVFESAFSLEEGP